MAKPFQKITVRCPHCSAEQQEPELVKSTFCRACSEYFSISAATRAAPAPAAMPKPRIGLPSALREPKPTPPPAPPPAEPGPSYAAGLLQKFDGLFASKPRVQVAHCFECQAGHEVSGTAQSTICKSCGAYIDLQDYRINTSFSRNIRTRGSLFVDVKGDLSSSKIICREVVVYGKLRGNLTCWGRMTLRVQGRVAGSIEVGELVVEKGSEVVFSRPIKASKVDIHGRVAAQIMSSGPVTIYRTGLLEGAVEASGFNVEKGGCYQGGLTIHPPRPASAAAEPESMPEAAPAPPLIGGDALPAPA